MNTRRCQTQTQVALLDFVRTPLYKLQDFLPTLGTTIVKTSLLSLFEKNPLLKQSVDRIDLSYLRPEGAPHLSFSEIKEGLQLLSSTQMKLSHFGSECAGHEIASSFEDITNGQSRISLLGGLEISPCHDVLQLFEKKKHFGKHEQKLKRSLPELSYLDDSTFLEVLNFSHLDPWQNQADSYKLFREDLDAYTKHSLNKTKSSLSENHESIVPLCTYEPHFHLFTKDQLTNKLVHTPSLAKAPTLQKRPNATMTSLNTSFSTEGSSFLVLGDLETAQKLEYDSHTILRGVATDLKPSLKNFTLFLESFNLTLDQIDFFEIPEYSAAHPLSMRNELDFPSLERINPMGGSLGNGYALASEPLTALARLKKGLELHRGTFGLAVIQSSYEKSSIFLLQREDHN